MKEIFTEVRASHKGHWRTRSLPRWEAVTTPGSLKSPVSTGVAGANTAVRSTQKGLQSLRKDAALKTLPKCNWDLKEEREEVSWSFSLIHSSLLSAPPSLSYWLNQTKSRRATEPRSWGKGMKWIWGGKQNIQLILTCTQTFK